VRPSQDRGSILLDLEGYFFTVVIIPHALIAAGLACLLPRGSRMAGAVVSHYVLDTIPHRDYDFKGHEERILIDGASAFMLVALAAPAKKRRLALTAAAVSCLPDVFNQIVWRWHRRVPAVLERPLLNQERLHTRLHCDDESQGRLYASLGQGAIAALGLGILLWQRRQS